MERQEEEKKGYVGAHIPLSLKWEFEVAFLRARKKGQEDLTRGRAFQEALRLWIDAQSKATP